jgi:hypothetical protein
MTIPPPYNTLPGYKTVYSERDSQLAIAIAEATGASSSTLSSLPGSTNPPIEWASAISVGSVILIPDAGLNASIEIVSVTMQHVEEVVKRNNMSIQDSDGFLYFDQWTYNVGDGLYVMLPPNGRILVPPGRSVDFASDNVQGYCHVLFRTIPLV